MKGDDGFEESVGGVSKSGGVFIIAFDDTDFSGGKVVSRIGYGYEKRNTQSWCSTKSKCTSFINDFNTNSHTDLTPKANDQLGSAVSFNHDGSLLAIGSIEDDG